MKDPQCYYDEFSNWYERARHRGYHAFLDDAEMGVISRYVNDKDVLEVGCGTGLILSRVADLAKSAHGVDISAGMLEKARTKGLSVTQASATSLPFDDASFDVAYSVKVLAHVPEIETALAEMARVVRPGGVVIAEFYNRSSLRYLVKRLRPGVAISEQSTDDQVYTRYDSVAEMQRYLGARLVPEQTFGIRVWTLAPQLFLLPVIGAWWQRLETWSVSSPLRQFGGFLMLVARRR